MALPPGPAYLLRLLPYFILPSMTVYVFLRLSEGLFSIVLSNCLTIPVIILAKPILFFATRHYRKVKDNWDANANNAILPPHVQESVYSMFVKLGESLRSGFPSDVMQEWAEEYGNTIQLDMLTTSTIITLDPEHVKIILSTQYSLFEKGPAFRDIFKSVSGSGIFNTDGEEWKFHRSITRPLFTRENISNLGVYERNCDISLKEARKRAAEGYSIDVQDLVSRFALDSTLEFLVGTGVDSVSAGIPYPPYSAAKNSASFNSHISNAFTNALMQGLRFTMDRIFWGSDWPLRAEFWKDKAAPMRRILDEFTMPLVEEALAQREMHLADKDTETESQKPTALENLLNHTQDPTVLNDEIINLLAAGRDSTTAVLTFSIYMLAEHPQVEEKLRQEIFERVGQSGNPTQDQMRGMKYMRAFLNGMYLFLIDVLAAFTRTINFVSRTSKEAITLPNCNENQKPFYCPSGTQVVYPIICIHHRTDLWGPDALKFDPDRFIDSRLHKYLTPYPSIFVPFSAGPRICIGQQLAYQVASFYLVRLLQQFTGFKLDPKANVQPPDEWKTCKGRKASEKVHVMAHASIHIKGGLWVTMKEVNQGLESE
ncbi:cytochrome P450 monooxygenase pc-3 [Pholiota conissans]|uniref:Cytochrome P450 monooxygenase pc-3 n=1 Tax=Pholiota conissans TaxID=109636 RepID=A0A9P5YU72_9AGAR|nr:cytochrome P450 monooxygenase pc-3 [Pholiota conissans]